MVVWHAHADRVSGDLVSLPFDRKGERSGAHDTEVEAVVRVLPDVLGVHDDIFLEGLLDSGVEFIAEAGINRSQVAWQIRRRRNKPYDRIAAPCAANHQILVEWSF